MSRLSRGLAAAVARAGLARHLIGPERADRRPNDWRSALDESLLRRLERVALTAR